uniref:Nuclear receptor subfamily 0 group B member 2-like n=1 Tax=Sinocyclocheilus anshuiensis TaxID=1608454 RepID=A0A671R9Y4_9TELE
PYSACLKMKQYFSDRHPRGILFSILSRECDFARFAYPDTCRSCHCKHLVCLRNPETTCRVAFGVLIKTVHFMKSLPSFQNLALRDRLVLEHVSFEVRVVPAASILRNILMNGRQKPDDCPPTLAEVHKLKTFLNKVWSLDLSLKEYSCLKSAVLFSQDAPGLRSSAWTAGLREEEAQRALHMWTLSHPHHTDHRTFTDMLFMASTLQMEVQSLVTELFFRPIAGQMDLHKLLREMIVKQ